MSDTHLYRVTGMTCGHCKSAVEESVAAVTGVVSVNADVDAGTVRITGNTNSDAIIAAISEAGYDVASGT